MLIINHRKTGPLTLIMTSPRVLLGILLLDKRFLTDNFNLRKSMFLFRFILFFFFFLLRSFSRYLRCNHLLVLQIAVLPLLSFWTANMSSEQRSNLGQTYCTMLQAKVWGRLSGEEKVAVAMCLTVLAGGVFARSKRTKPVIIFGVDSLSTHHWLMAGVRYRYCIYQRGVMYVPLEDETDLENRQMLTRTWLEVNVDRALRIKITYDHHVVSHVSPNPGY